MDQKKQEQPREQVNHAPTETQANGENQNQSNQIMQLSHPLIHSAGASAFSSYLSRDQFQHFSQNFFNQQALYSNLATFWANQYKEIQETVDFKKNRIPLLRIKKIMKVDKQVNKISAGAPLLLAKACEMFIMELTIRSWANADFNKRRTLHKCDIASAISNTDIFDFLVDIVPKEDTMEHDIFTDVPRRESVPIRNVNVPYYYVPVPVQPQYVPVQPQYVAGK
ncbi:hypothetical protein TSUD_380500 [Trifolium subterraneum]|uniref:Transcription factor CBF/NF-Y/archaeal histone domain-containing protein n=1 Tax=Trifolium subterraneum TaxID=3900 RepID=A0A2Z6P0Y8_TRISU|nr:hypothetical protein TSUD_380500 [Trifolium subterraneum]